MELNEESITNERHILKVNRRYCPHCHQSLSIKTFKAHKRLYFNSTTSEWSTHTRATSDLNSGSDEGSESPPVSLGHTSSELTQDLPYISPYFCSDTEDNLSSGESDNNGDDGDEVWTTELDDVTLDFEPLDTEPVNIGTTNVTDSSKPSILVRYIVAFISSLRKDYYLSEKVSQLLLQFFSILFGILGIFSSLCKSISALLPSSIYMMNKNTSSQFRRYVVCKKCHQVYFFDQCVTGEGTHKRSKQCPYVAFPLHPHAPRRLPCNALLLKSVEVASGRSLWYPVMSYCYRSVEDSLQAHLLQPNFHSQCEHWRSRNRTEISDVMDGRIWNEFLTYDSNPFLSEPWNYALMMNVDWFQPFKHVNYSVGVIYLTIMNLPRHIRFKRDNIIIVGIIPGPHEPSLNINSFLEPLVNELAEFWIGKELNVHGSSNRQKVRCALLCVSCDLPAGRKVCGFLSYTARYGCSRCLKPFPGTFGSMDYSGFSNRDSWTKRTREAHIVAVTRIQACKTKSAVARAEAENGYRNSVLLKLPYFDPARMLVIDPMHNLFLGTGKYVLKHIWLELKLIDESHYGKIQDRIDRMVVPSDIGRIPHKILSGFSSFTADQFKNWILYFSVIALRDILIGDHFQCWLHYVLACRRLCKRQMTSLDIQLGDALLLQFCTRVEKLYGNHTITPNMHLHAHLRECLLDFGSFYGFWCFSYERFNGILGHIPNNNRSIELQIMKRFLGDMEPNDCMPLEYKSESAPIFGHGRQLVGSVLDTLQEPINRITELPDLISNWGIENVPNIRIPTYFSRAVLSASEVDGLKLFFARLYSVPLAEVMVNSVIYKFKNITLNGTTYGSEGSRSSSSSIVMVSWFPRLLCVDGNQDTRPARINHFVKHAVTIQNTTITHIMFSASWFKPHPDKLHYGKPISIWHCDLYEENTCTSLLPVQLIIGRTVSLVDKLEFGACETALLVCPFVE